MQRLAQFSRLGFLAVLIAILCVGPLLHAHMGTPLQNGFHLDLPMRGLSKVLLEEGAAKQVSVEHNGNEPFSIEMEKGVSRDTQLTRLDPALIESLLPLCAILLVAASFVSRPLPRAARPHPQGWRDAGSRPPPAQAPPLFS